MPVKNADWLRANITRLNIAEDMDRYELDRIGQVVVRGYDIDKESRKDWEDLTQQGLDIAMQKRVDKTSPWPGCANVKHPLIGTASLQFAARAYPEIIKGSDVVRATVIGADPDGRKEDRAKRVGQHMSWQLTTEMEEWEEDTDRLLHSLPIIGVCYRKTYYDRMWGRNRSEFRTGLTVVVNNAAKNMATVRRVTDDELWLYKNDVIEKERAGMFCEGISDVFTKDPDENAQEQFLEQHCFFDLDGDGYEEPYIVTVHRDTGRVARIIARYDDDGIIEDNGKVLRIMPVQYFTKFPFIPSFDGGFHDIGFAQLIGPLNESMNTIMNQLLDAGTLANLQGGFIGKGIKWQGGRMTFQPGEWKQVDVMGGTIKENIVPLPRMEPSSVLLQMLGALKDAADRLASVSDVMAGEMPSQNTPATTVLAMIEQGLKVFTSIYKRVYRSLKSEYRKIYRLNRLYLPEEQYFRVLDDRMAIARADYDLKDLDIVPVADPTISSEAQRLARSRALMDTLAVNPFPMGKLEILRTHYSDLNVPDIDKYLPPEDVKKLAMHASAPPPPNPALLKLEAEIIRQKHDYELAVDRLALDHEKFNLEVEKKLADIELVKANAIKAIADAEAKEFGQQFEMYRHEIETLSEQVRLTIAAKEANTRASAAVGGVKSGPPADNPGPDARGNGGVEGQPANTGSVQVPEGSTPELSGPDATGSVEDQLSGVDGPVDIPAVGNNLRAGYNAHLKGDGTA